MPSPIVMLFKFFRFKLDYLISKYPVIGKNDTLMNDYFEKLTIVKSHIQKIDLVVVGFNDVCRLNV